MNQKFDVYLEGRVIGYAQFQKKGLYYHIRCRCKLADDKICRLHATCGDQLVDLGICIPFADGFGVDMIIPVKYIRTDDLKLYLSPKQEVSDAVFIRLDPQLPFMEMACLMHARFERRNGEPGLLIIKN